MEEISTVGIDLAKSVLQIHALGELACEPIEHEAGCCDADHRLCKSQVPASQPERRSRESRCIEYAIIQGGAKAATDYRHEVQLSKEDSKAA
ncbi:hypothetical protein ACG873_02175 [Mesorhizobium sp. AaZ16]|uniref:hypothetical protein n=1 Tax=Mesorhizobium sp. AaZ16 TaxID=3402289 RepID=UPI00374F2307